MNDKTIQISGGGRKYSRLWKLIKTEGRATIKCAMKDVLTITNGVKKEKLQDKSKPQKKILSCTPTDIGVFFELIDDTSINNL